MFPASPGAAIDGPSATRIIVAKRRAGPGTAPVSSQRSVTARAASRPPGPAEAIDPRAQPPASPGDGAHSSERVHHGASSFASAPMGRTTCSPGRQGAAT